MATADMLARPADRPPDARQTAAHSAQAPLLISLPTLSSDALSRLLEGVHGAFAGRTVLVATPGAEQYEPYAASQGVTLVSYVPAAAPTEGWTLTAADFLNVYELIRQHGAAQALLLGAEAQSLTPASLQALAGSAADLGVAHYRLPVRAGLVNSAILYPLTRALFGTVPRFPLALDLCLSARMAERMATQAQRMTAAGQPDALLWPVAEAAVAGISIADVPGIERTLPQPGDIDLSTLLARVAGSLFADIEQKAVFWQRARPVPPAGPQFSTPGNGSEEIQPLIETFRLAHGNLHEIWSLVLPPQTLFGLKRLASTPAETFTMPEPLWARIVYDFVLAHRLRTMNRGHLLGALTPLYLAWAASHLRQTADGLSPERHIEATAAAFEADKAYLVSRWRWPDRFNP